jgi:hypothetical protein
MRQGCVDKIAAGAQEAKNLGIIGVEDIVARY